MFIRLSIFLGILIMIAGIFIAVGSAFPGFAKVIAAPFCDEILEDRFGFSPRCINDGQEQDLGGIMGFAGTMVIMGGTFLLVFGIVGGLAFSSMKQNRILKTGESAQALITSMEGTGTRVNGQPLMRFRLQVRPPYGQPYEAETSRIVPYGMLGRLALGMMVPVKYNPANPQEVALDFNAVQLTPISMGGLPVAGVNTSGQKSLTDKLQELKESYDSGLINQQEYDTARQKIIGSF